MKLLCNSYPVHHDMQILDIQYSAIIGSQPKN